MHTAPSHSRIHGILDCIANHQGVAVKTSKHLHTYSELRNRVRELSRHLRSCTAQGSVVAVLSSSSMDVCVSFLAIIDAGCVALLIDSGWAPDWISTVLSDAKPGLVLTPHKDRLVTVLSEPLPGFYAGDTSMDGPNLGDAASYIIYTSGTTGTPKGVINSIDGLTNLFFAVQSLFQLSSKDTILQFSSPSFDAWIWDMCLAFSAGATLAIPEPDRRLPGAGLEEAIKKHAVTVTTLPPSVLHGCKAEDLAGVHTLITAGERCSKDLAKAWLEGRRLYNAYGPSEAAVCATIHLVTTADNAPAIGTAIPGFDVWLEDAKGQKAPPGSSGEIVIGGKGVALGYLNRPELTATKFTRAPATFRTGDSAIQGPDQLLYYEGRIDRQAKVNGVRIELDHVEEVIERNAHVLQAFVAVDDSDLYKPRLVAFVLPKAHVAASELRSQLTDLCRRQLPARTSPIIVFVSALPIKGSGKIDMQSLLAEHIGRNEARAPGEDQDIQGIITEVMRTHLGLPDMQGSDDFFLSGGGSLAMIQCAVAIGKRLGCTLPISIAMQHSTPEQLADAIERHRNGESVIAQPLTVFDVPAQTLSPRTPPPHAKDVLVTGGTGLLGAHVISELLDTTQCKIYCLVRAEDGEQAFQRLKANLDKHRLYKPPHKDRIVALVGSVEHEHFGLEADTYEGLRHTVRQVYHIAANVSWVLGYSALESANVAGTMNAIQLCSDSGAKLAYVSSIGVHFSESWRDAESFHEDELPPIADHSLGYLRTKWVSEQLVRNAMRQGLEACVFRPPFICGGMGRNADEVLAQDDFLLNKLQACIALGAIPSAGFHLDIYPADILAKFMVAMTANTAAGNRTFHLTNPHKMAWSEVPTLMRSYGHYVEVIEYDRWLERATQYPNELDPHIGYIKRECADRPSAYEHHHGIWPEVIDDNVTFALSRKQQVPSVAALLSQYLAEAEPAHPALRIMGSLRDGRSNARRRRAAAGIAPGAVPTTTTLCAPCSTADATTCTRSAAPRSERPPATARCR